MTQPLYRILSIAIVLLALSVPAHAQVTPYPGGPTFPAPEPDPDPVCNPYTGCEPEPQPGPGPVEPPPIPTCPAGHTWNPYDGLCYAPAPQPAPEPEPGSGPAPEPDPQPEPPEPVKPLWRSIPGAVGGEPFAELVEQGPAAEVETYGLQGTVPAFVWYARETGAYWLVVDGVYGPERVCAGMFEPRLNLVVLDLDADGQDDLLGHDVSTGRVYRLYSRHFNRCR